MLQHNKARGAHLAHATVMSLHALCCGIPAAAMAAAALTGGASGVILFSDSLREFHGSVHAYELWVLGFSAALVVLGGILELSSRRGHAHGFPWLFAFSVACFAINAGIVFAHHAA
jgi:hypothetical protein